MALRRAMECTHEGGIRRMTTFCVEAIVIVVVVQLRQMILTVISLDQGQAESTHLLRLNYLVAGLKR